MGVGMGAPALSERHAAAAFFRLTPGIARERFLAALK
jgi:hypothetical protein